MKLHFVQALRALAAILVVFSHSFEYAQPSGDFTLIRMARFGVILFFVISGFIMVYITGPGRFDIGEFLRRRLLRIVPLYWLATTAIALLVLVAPFAVRRTQFTFDHYVLSLLFVPHPAPNGDLSPLLKLGWTLNYEMFFYLVFAALGMLDATRRVVTVTVGFVALWLFGLGYTGDDPLIRTYTDYFVLAFVCGMWAGWALKLFPGRVTLPTTRTALTLLFLLGLAGTCLLEPGTRGSDQVGIAMALTAAALILLGPGLYPERHPPRVVELLGDASYSLYLTHMYMIGALVFVSRRLGLLQGHATAVAIVAFLLSILSGLVVYWTVERPLLRIATRFHRRSERA